MRLITFLLISWLVAGGLRCSDLHAQATILAAGGQGSGSGGSVSYSVGQLAYLSGSGVGGTSSPGVQQPLELLVLSSTSPVLTGVACAVYPNPTATSLTLQVAAKLPHDLTYRLTDLSGRQLLSQRVAGPLMVISLADFAAGAYLLTIYNNARANQTFKIIKY